VRGSRRQRWSEEPTRGHDDRRSVGPASERVVSQFGRPVDAKAKGPRDGDARPELASSSTSRTYIATDGFPLNRSREGDGRKIGTQAAEVEAVHVQRKADQIGRGRREPKGDERFRDAIQDKPKRQPKEDREDQLQRDREDHSPSVPHGEERGEEELGGKRRRRRKRKHHGAEGQSGKKVRVEGEPEEKEGPQTLLEEEE